jgi:two-component system CheB/CheR fusion protein
LGEFLDNAGIVAVAVDRELRVRSFTPAARDICEDIASANGKPLGEVRWNLVDDTLLSDADLVLREARPRQAYVRGREHGRHYLRRIAPLRAGTPTANGIVITLVDVADSLPASGLSSCALDAHPVASIVADAQGKIVYLNAAAEHRCGYLRAQLLAQPLQMVLPGVDPLLASRQVPDALPVVTLKHYDGSESQVRVELSTLNVGSRSHLLVTRFEDAERASGVLREAKEEVARANRAKSRFLAAAGHDLRQPLQTLSLLNAVLAQRAEDAETRQLVERQAHAVAAMRDLLNVFMDLVRTSRGVVTPPVSAFVVTDLLDRIRHQFAPAAEARGIKLRVARCSMKVSTDPALLYRVFEKLVHNALSYTAAGRVLVGCRRRGDRVRFEVWDTGSGIPPDQLDVIFEEFVQLDNPARQADKGYGLGLAVASNIAATLGVKLEVRSTLGKGSVFAVEVAREDSAAPCRYTPSVYRGPSGARILLVEDDPVVSSATRSLLEGLGLEVTSADNGDAAVQLVRAEQRLPDLVIADYRLPGRLSGVATVREIRSTLSRDVPALLVTGDTSAESVREMQGSGLQILYKPLEGKDLMVAMNGLLMAGRGVVY